MRELKLIDGEYESKEVALIEVTETKEPIVVKSTVNKDSLLRTIEYLENKKAKYIAGVDEEIELNNNMLAEITPISETATIVALEERPSEEAIPIDAK